MLSILYITSHFFSFFLLQKIFRPLYFIIAIPMILTVYFFKNPSFDLITYIEAVGSFWLEPGFSLILFGINIFAQNNFVTIVIVQVLTTVLFGFLITLEERSFRTFCYATIIFISSLSFALGIHNALRQALAMVIIFFAIYSCQRFCFFLL